MYMRSRITGLLSLAVGIGHLGGATDWWDFSTFFPGWWILFLIIPTVFSSSEDGFHFGNGCVFISGVYLLCSANDWISIRLTWGMLVVTGLILLGCRMIIGDSLLRFKHSDSALQEEDGRRDLRSTTYLGNKRLNAHGIAYSLKTESAFGTQMVNPVDVDLTEYGYVKLEAVSDSIDLLVSDRMYHRAKSENVFGDTRVKHHPKGSQDLVVDISCVFGTINLRKMRVEDDTPNGKYREK